MYKYLTKKKREESIINLIMAIIQLGIFIVNICFTY